MPRDLAERRESYWRNRDARLTQARAYKLAKREAILAKEREYREANLDKVRARQRARYARKRAELVAKQAEQRRKARESGAIARWHATRVLAKKARSIGARLRASGVPVNPACLVCGKHAPSSRLVGCTEYDPRPVRVADRLGGEVHRLCSRRCRREWITKIVTADKEWSQKRKELRCLHAKLKEVGGLVRLVSKRPS